MRFLALDIGRRKTGIAYFDSATDIPLPLDTFRHVSIKELVTHVKHLASKRGIDHVIIGLPLLPSGEEGSQSRFVREVASLLTENDINVAFQDERYSTNRVSGNDEHARAVAKNSDGDAAAACTILTTYLKC